MSVSTWSTDPNLNINQLGLSLADGVTRIRDLNDQFRVLMSQVKLKFDTVDLAVAGLPDSDLTAIAALTTTNFGRNFLTLTDANAALTYVQAQPLDADLTAIAALTTTAFGRGMLTQAGTAGALAYLGAQAALGFTPLNATAISAFGLTLVGGADAAAMRSTLSLGTAAIANIGTSGANVPLLNGANTWATTQTFAGVNVGGLLNISNNDPTQDFIDTDAAANEGRWRITTIGASFALYAANDALSAFTAVFSTARTGATPTAFFVHTGLFPASDNARPLGGALNRWSGLFAASARIEAADAAPLSTGALTAACAGTIVTLTGGITAPASVFTARNFVLLVNNSGASQTITQGAGLTLQFGALTGNRTMASGTIALIVYVGGAIAIISGPGIS